LGTASCKLKGNWFKKTQLPRLPEEQKAAVRLAEIGEKTDFFILTFKSDEESLYTFLAFRKEARTEL
jgi:hypothetical protein